MLVICCVMVCVIADRISSKAAAKVASIVSMITCVRMLLSLSLLLLLFVLVVSSFGATVLNHDVGVPGGALAKAPVDDIFVVVSAAVATNAEAGSYFGLLFFL